MRDLKDQTFIQQLLEKVTSSGDKQTIVRVVTDHGKALKALHADSTVANRKNFLDAEEQYLKNVSEIASRYYPEDDGEESTPQTFKNKKEALEYIQESGWQISQSQFYAHCKSGLLRPGADGQYQQRAVDRYAKTWLKQLATGERVNERTDRLQQEKMEVDLSTSKFKMEEAEFNLGIRKNKFIPREDFELAIVGRAVAFMAHLNHTVQSEAADWIDIVGGNQDRAPELVAAISRAIEQRMGDFAADAEFDVILEAN